MNCTPSFRPRRRLPAPVLSLLCGLLAFAARPVRVSAAPDVRGFDTVILDAGHGGHDRGGAPYQRGLAEKVVTLDTALRLERILRARGLRVIMTRSTDNFIPLSQRVAATRGYDPRSAVFVSIHFNGGQREGARGIETYYYRGDSFALAARLHRELVSAMDTEDRSLRRRPFYVVRKSAVPAVLLECGFLTNNSEQDRIGTGAYRQRLAESIAGGLLAQRRAGNLADAGSQPAVTSERLGGSRRTVQRGRRGSRRVHLARSRRGGRSHYASSRGRAGRTKHHASRRAHRRSRR